MNYLKVYCNLIRKAENRTPPEGYTEKHHTFPVSIFGKNKRIVVLTGREHYVAHALLEKAFIMRYGLYHYKTRKMNFAHNCMKCRNKYFNSYLYENARKRRIHILKEQKINCGENHPLYGKPLSDETKRKISDALKGKPNLHSEEIRQKRIEGGKKGGKRGGKISGPKTYEMKVGVHGRTKEKRIEDARKGGLIGGSKGAKNTNSQKWMCLETGYITNSGALTHYQRAKGIDTSKRKRVE